MNIIDLSIENEILYNGLPKEMVAGNWRLTAPLNNDTNNTIALNAKKIISNMTNKEKLQITGRAPIWVYLIVFHMVVHQFKEVYYFDGGKNPELLIAGH